MAAAIASRGLSKPSVQPVVTPFGWTPKAPSATRAKRARPRSARLSEQRWAQSLAPLPAVAKVLRSAPSLGPAAALVPCMCRVEMIFTEGDGLRSRLAQEGLRTRRDRMIRYQGLSGC